MLAIGYTRVSTSAQSQEGVSLDAQAQSIAAWCQAHGYRLDSVYIETGSAARADRRDQFEWHFVTFNEPQQRRSVQGCGGRLGWPTNSGAA